MSEVQKVAFKLLSRKRGITVAALADHLGLAEKSARSVVDTLRKAGKHIENIAPGRFRLTA